MQRRIDRSRRWQLAVAGLAAAGLGGAALMASRHDAARALARSVWSRWRGGYTVADRVAQHELDVRRRLQPLFARAGLSSVPREVTLLAFKDSRQLALYARDEPKQPWQRVTTYRVQGASGGSGRGSSRR